MLREDELNLLGDARCGTCSHLIGLHTEVDDDWGPYRPYRSCAVCQCTLPHLGPEPKPRPRSQMALFRGSVGIPQ